MNNSELRFNSDNFSDTLSDTLKDVLDSAFSDNLPDTLVTSLKDNLELFADSRPNGLDLLQGDDTSIIPFLFNDDPETNFPNIYGDYTNVLTTSGEINIGTTEDQEVKLIWGRHGGDNLIGFDPGADHEGKREIDIFTGDWTDEQLFGLRTGQEIPFTDGEDRFILGNWEKPFYVENDETLGLNQFAFIIDFNSSQDIIQLHGTSQDYQLVETDLGTAIFWHQNNETDLVGVVGGVDDLSLEGDYFDFKGSNAPETVLEDSQQIGSSAIDYVFTSSVDAEGNLYVGGSTGGSLEGDNLGARDGWLRKYDSNGNYLWGDQLGTSGTDTIWDMASDGSNIYVAGNTSESLPGNTTEGGNDVYLAKYDSEGNQEWIQQFGTLTFDESFTVNTDSDGNVYVGGHTVGSLGGENKNTGQNLDNLDDQSAFLGFPSTDSYVVKFDSEGNQEWIHQFGTFALDDNWGVAIDENGNVFAGGNTKGDFGGPNAGQFAEYDPWLVKLDQDGNEVWVEQFGTPGYDFLWDIETDSMGNVYATGWTLGDLGGENAGSYDTWLAKYDTDGNQVWVEQFGTSGDDSPSLDSIEIDSNDNIFVSGYTEGNLGGENAGSYDAWVAKFDTDGSQLWLEQFGTTEYDAATTVSADDYGNLYVSGITEGSIGETNAGAYDSWIVKLDAEEGTIQDFTGDDSSSNNVLNGSSASDILQGSAEDDLISGNGGKDILEGGSGDDTINGGSLPDIIDGGRGDDLISGNGGEDILEGGSGDDTINGGSLRDIIDGGRGDDLISGNGGEDILEGGSGDDTISGGSLRDFIEGGRGDDLIYSNGGNDYIDSGNGLDIIWLGAGNTNVVLKTGEGYDTIENFQLGSTKFQVSSLNNLSFSDSAGGAEIFQGSDLIAIVSQESADTFSSNIDEIFV
ncbi:MAG: SBBP repeat-containing protein [Xenococcaceae cyanobacterium]